MTQSENYCPARDKNTGKCCGCAYFRHKPGPIVECPGDCSARRKRLTRSEYDILDYRACNACVGR